MAKGAGYDASRTASHRDLSWRPFCSIFTPLTCQPPSPESMHMLWADPQWNADVWRSGWILNGARSGRTIPWWLRTSIPGTGTHHRNDPPKKSLGPAQPPPHRCRTFPLLPVQMGYDLLWGLWVWRRRTNRGPCRPPLSNPPTPQRTTPAWRFWMMRQPNGCSTPAPISRRASSG